MRVYQALALLAVAAAPIAALADNINLNSGTAMYNVTGPGYSGPAITVPTPNPAWTASIPPGASWINTTGGNNDYVANGLYVYTVQFTLTTPSSDLSGLFASDNAATVSLTGSAATFSNTYADSYSTDTPFSYDDLGPGMYTLTFDVTNGGGNESPTGTGPTGLLVGASVSSVPEPSSLALLGTGLLGAAGIARRKFFSR